MNIDPKKPLLQLTVEEFLDLQKNKTTTPPFHPTWLCEKDTTGKKVQILALGDVGQTVATTLSLLGNGLICSIGLYDANPNAAMRLEGLSYRTEARAELLNWVSVAESSSLEGNWQNAWGSIKVEKKSPDKLSVQVDVSDQANGSWICSFEGVLNQKSAGEAEFESKSGPLILKLDGAALKIPTPFCDESTSGGFGSAAGTYFRVGAE